MKKMWIGLLLCAPSWCAAEVRKSEVNLCHTAQSPHYQGLTSFAVFPDLKSCLDSGGQLTREDRAKFHNYSAWMKASYPEMKDKWQDLADPIVTN